MTLNNSISDGSYVKQCLGYQLFADAGLPAPRCNFATVEVNGENLGVFVHVESIKKRFLGRHFEDNDGNLYEGALSDFRPGWENTFQRKTNKRDLDRSDITGLTEIMDLDDTEFLAALEQVLDVDEFITMWAAELLMMHADGYARNTNNFYMYNDPIGGRFSFIPWGIDSIMFNDTVLPWEDQLPPVTAWAEGTLARRLYRLPETRTRYFSRLQELWHESDLLAEIDRMDALISPFVTDDLQGFAAQVRAVRSFVSTRRGQLEAELNSQPEWDRPLRDPWCIPVLGTLSGSFQTTWATIDTEDVFTTGPGTLDLALDTLPPDVMEVASAAGYDPDSGTPVVRLVARTSATQIHVVQVAIPDPAMLTPGASIAIDWIDASGYVMAIEFASGTAEFTVIRYGRRRASSGQRPGSGRVPDACTYCPPTESADGPRRPPRAPHRCP